MTIRTSDLEKIPVHLAIIMDGNGRWAKRRGMPRIFGHRQGVKTVKDIVTAAREIGIKVLTLYAFSKENWNRPKDEVSTLMDLLYGYLESELEEMLENQISLRAIGEVERLPDRVRKKLFETIERTAHHRGMVLNLAISYGGRQEIARAARILAERCLRGHMDPKEIDERAIANCLYTAGLPDPDLVIRTSGEMRLSNFLLFQCAYSEIYITKTLWPDFSREELLKALYDYQRRERRFGLTSEQIAKRQCTANVF